MDQPVEEGCYNHVKWRCLISNQSGCITCEQAINGVIEAQQNLESSTRILRSSRCLGLVTAAYQPPLLLNGQSGLRNGFQHRGPQAILHATPSNLGPCQGHAPITQGLPSITVCSGLGLEAALNHYQRSPPLPDTSPTRRKPTRRSEVLLPVKFQRTSPPEVNGQGHAPGISINGNQIGVAGSSVAVESVAKAPPPQQNSPILTLGFKRSTNHVEVEDGDKSADTGTEIEEVASAEKVAKKKRNPVTIYEHISILSGDPLFYKCRICRKKFKTRANIKYHEFCQNGLGLKPFKCDECGQGFITKSHFEYHLRTHTGERPYVCPKCGKAFNQRGKVTRHMRSHTGEKPFVCPTCGRGFANNQAMRSHLLIHTGERPFPCEYCDKRFTGKTNLKKHVLTHTGERPFMCTLCGKCFGLKWTLDLHLRTHSRERPHACDQCSKAFISGKDLRRHIVVHSDERPFQCWICGTDFRRKDNLGRHIEITHNQPKDVAKQLANEAEAEYLVSSSHKGKCTPGVVGNLPSVHSEGPLATCTSPLSKATGPPKKPEKLLEQKTTKPFRKSKGPSALRSFTEESPSPPLTAEMGTMSQNSEQITAHILTSVSSGAEDEEILPTLILVMS